MQAFWGDIQNAFFTIAGFAARLLGGEGHRVAFIQQTQFPLRVAGGAWVQVDTAFQQIAMEIRNQRANVARGIRALGWLIFFWQNLMYFFTPFGNLM